MARKNRQIEKLEITDISSQGFGIGRNDGKVIFVENAIPGDIVNVKIRQKKKDYSKGFAYSFEELSADRQEAFCSHFGACGGCKWQYLTYEKQLSYKEGIVANAMYKWKDQTKALPILPSEQETEYRNKLEYSFSNKAWLVDDEEPPALGALGMHPPKFFDKVVQLEKCHLQENLSNEIRNFIGEFCRDEGLSFHDAREHSGLMRNLILRNNRLGEWMMILVIFEEQEVFTNKLFTLLKGKFPAIKSAYLAINSKHNDSLDGITPQLIFGETQLPMKLNDLKFQLGPKSFFQTNSRQAERLYDLVMDFADLKGDERCIDLYTGIGTIALSLAQKSASVVGLEYVEEAILDAKENAIRNEIPNAKFEVGDIKDLIPKYSNFDLVVTDPPRAGMHADVIEGLLRIEAPKIVYVSCNPATQARDIALLATKYRLTKYQPVDMFPQTKHIENVALLELNDTTS